MPPTTRRTISEPSTPPHQYLEFSLFGPSHLPITQRPRRVHSASSSPYPTSRQAIDEARDSSRNADSTRRILGELDWWVRMSGQRDEEEDEYDYEEDEEEEEEWETVPEEEAQNVEATTPSASDIISHNDNDNDDDDTISECSESQETVHSDASTLTGYEATDYEQEYPQSTPLLHFPTTFPPLANLLSSQVGSEPSRRASRANANRANANRPSQSTLTWDYSTSSMMITSVTPASPPSSPGQPTICRSSPRRASSIAPGSVADNIVRDALALPSPSKSKASKPPIDFLPLSKFPISIFMVSPSILTFR